MAVTKRTRFEVLRRDNYTCRYCRSTEHSLTIDHVTPVALGGSDDPSNLVACCRDCNSGKGSTKPDEETVAQVTEEALRFAGAIKRAAKLIREERGEFSDDLDWFVTRWVTNTVDAELSTNWRQTIRNYLAAGLDRDDLDEAIDAATARVSPYSPWQLFPYFCGVCRNKAARIRERAEALLTEEEGESA